MLVQWKKVWKGILLQLAQYKLQLLCLVGFLVCLVVIFFLIKFLYVFTPDPEAIFSTQTWSFLLQNWMAQSISFFSTLA